MNPIGFDDLAGDRKTFFTEHLGTRPLLRAGALGDRVRSVLSVEQFGEVIGLEAMTAPYLRITKQGKPIPRRRFTRPVVRPGQPLTEKVDVGKVSELYDDGATIAMNALDHFLPAVRQLLRSASEPFGAGGEAVAFLTPAGNPGFAPHTDPVDIFVVQIEGAKAWRLWDRVPVGTTVTAESLGPPGLEITLRAGDVLYMPPSTPHAAVAQEQLSLHLGLSIEPPTWRDLVHACVDALMGHEYQAAAYLGPEADPVSGFADLLGQLRSRLGTVDVKAELERLADRPAGPSRADFSGGQMKTL